GACCPSMGTASSAKSAVNARRFICPPRTGDSMLFAFPANDAVFAVFENDALRRQFLADAIGFRKVSAFAGHLPGRDELLDLLLAGRAGARLYANGAKFCIIIVLENAKNGVKCLQCFL